MDLVYYKNKYQGIPLQGTRPDILNKMHANTMGITIPSFHKVVGSAPIISDKQFPSHSYNNNTGTGFTLNMTNTRLVTSSSSCPDSLLTSIPTRVNVPQDLRSKSDTNSDRPARSLFGIMIDTMTGVIDSLLSRSKSLPLDNDLRDDDKEICDNLDGNDLRDDKVICEYLDLFHLEDELSDVFSGVNDIEYSSGDLARSQFKRVNGLGEDARSHRKNNQLFGDETEKLAYPANDSSSASVGQDERVRTETDRQEKGEVEESMDAKKLSRFLERVKERTRAAEEAAKAQAVRAEEPVKDSVASCQDKIADLKRLLSAKKSVISDLNVDVDRDVRVVEESPVPSTPSDNVDSVKTLAETPKNVIENPEIPSEKPVESNGKIALEIPVERIETVAENMKDLNNGDNEIRRDGLKIINEISENIIPVKAAVMNCEDKLAQIKEILSKKKSVDPLRNVETKIVRDDVISTPLTENEKCTTRQESLHNTNLCENKLKSEKHPDRPSKEMKKQAKRKKRSKDNRDKKNPNSVDDKYVPDRTVSDSQNINCDKRHRNSKCSKKHKHKDRQSNKLLIRDDLAFDSDADVKSPLYFSPETLQIHSPEKNLKKNNCKITESIDKCKNFISKHINKEQTEVIKQKSSSTDLKGFDEIKGKFRGSESDSDQFIIVFSDQPGVSPQNEKPITISDSCKKMPLPKNNYRRKEPSECESEESFEICFVNDNNDCYGNDEVYSDSATETGSDEDDSCSESSEMETDSSGYVEENKENDSENDLTLVQCGDECDENVQEIEEEEVKIEKKLKSCLKKPKERRSPKLPSPERQEKKVKFDENKPKVHKMIVWAHAYQQARIGPWERCARDAERFKQRITVTSTCLDWVFKREHRNRIFFQRFRPILMRAIREEKEAKAREAKRLKEEEALRIKQEEEAALKLKQEEEAALKLKQEEEEALRIKQEEEEALRINQEEENSVYTIKDDTLRNEKDGEFLIKMVENADIILNESGVRDCNQISIPNEMFANG